MATGSLPLPVGAGKRNDFEPIVPQTSSSLIMAVVAFYWAVSLSVVFLNKFILSYSEYKFPYPLFVTWFQLVVALVLLVGLGRMSKKYTHSSACLMSYER